MSKISAYTAITSVETDDLLVVVDVHDTSMASTGTTKKMTLAQLDIPAIDVTASDIQPVGTAAAAGSKGEAADAGHVHAGVQLAGDLGNTIASPQVTSTHLASALPFAQGGTSAATQQGALDAIAGAVTSGEFLRGSGSHVQMAAIQAADLPYQPWQFTPESYGAKGNGVLVADGVMSSSVNPTHLACASSTPFASGDAGKHVLVAGAGAAGAFLAATISTFTDSGHVVLSAGASTTVSGAGVLFGTDDTAAVQSAVNAAVTYAQGTGRGYGEVRFGNSVYCIAGAPVTGGSTFGNAQITLPVVTATAGLKVTLGLIGAPDRDSSPGPHWLQVTPSLSGTVLACMRLDGAYNGTNGPTSIIGGPVNGYGGGLGIFSNMEVLAEGLTFTSAFPGTYCALDLYGVGQCWIPSLSYIPLATVPSGTAWPQINANNNQWQFLLRYPTVGNNDRCDAGQLTAYGCGTAIIPNEHATCDSLRTLYCYNGIQPGYAAGTASVHGAVIRYWSCEGTQIGVNWYGFEAANAGSFSIRVQHADFESWAHMFHDPSALAAGEIWFNFLQATDTYFSGSVGVQTTTGWRIFHENANPGPVSSPQAPVASGSAWFNGYYRDAFITLKATTITALSIDSTAQEVPSGATSINFMVPAGHSYTWTGTGTVGTNVFHTVTLL